MWMIPYRLAVKAGHRMEGNDRRILKDLARCVGEIAGLDVMRAREGGWGRINALKPGMPMIAVFPEGAYEEVLPWSALRCVGALARRLEWDLRSRIFQHEVIGDDRVVSAEVKVRKRVTGLGSNVISNVIDWGVRPLERTYGGPRGSYATGTVIEDITDIGRLRVPELGYDEAATKLEFEEVGDALGDILDVRIKGIDHIGFHIMYFYIHFRGYERTLYDFHDDPDFARALIGFLESGYASIIRQIIDLNLLSLNNDGTNHGSGGFGYTDELPKEGFDPMRVRARDVWATSESQELSPVSPEMTEEFVMGAERRLLEGFGLTAYGCCEAMEGKLRYITKLGNLRRISVSPFSDFARCAEEIGDGYVYSWKPNPSYISSPSFDGDDIRSYFTRVKAMTKGCVLEILSGDTHTCHGQAGRFTDWVRICREVFQGQ